MNVAKKISLLTACLVGFFLGGIGLFAYSPFDIWGISFISAVALIWLATLPQRNLALWGVFVWGISYFAWGVNWVHVSMIQFGGVPEFVSYLAVLLLAIYLALYPLLFAFLAQIFNLRSAWVLAGLWTGTEYLRGVVFTGFPWLQFGYSLIDSPFAGIAPILGVEGLSFFVILVSGQAVQIGRKIAEKSLNLRACFPLFTTLLFALSSQLVRWVDIDPNQKAISVSLIQGNIEQRMKWDPEYFDYTLQTYERLISEVLGKSEVIILPESAIPATERQIEPLLHKLDRMASSQGSELIIGTLNQNEQGIFNSALVLGQSIPYSQASSPRFNKHHLVPFGEYVPFGNLLDWMRDIFILPVNLEQGEFIQSPLKLSNRYFNTAICYEIIFGDQLQQNQKVQPADYLLTISNDAWFGESIGPWQHFQMARMRALELGKPLIRATNTGITAFVDAYGVVIKQAPQFTPLVLSHTVSNYQGQTPFSFWGNRAIFGWSIVMVMLAILRRYMKK